MRPSFILLIYQNQLFAEGLECILQNNNYEVLKINMFDFKESNSDYFENTEIMIIEASWPSPKLENIINNVVTFFGGNAKILLVTNLINKNIFHLVSENRIKGIVLKSSSGDEFLFGIKQVIDSKTYYSSVVANVFVKNRMEPQKLSISIREKQILTLLAEMNSTEEIAIKLSITKSTVKTHRRNLMSKLHSKNTLCLIRTACRENLLNTDNHFCGCCYKQLLEV
jgi:DNA-binding NarL/FixJ family response regulator